MASEIEAKTDGKLEAKPEAGPETKAELPFVSLLDSLAAAGGGGERCRQSRQSRFARGRAAQA